jgi:protein TonB
MQGSDKRVMVAVLATCAAAIVALVCIGAWWINDHVGGWWQELAAPSATVAERTAHRPATDVPPTPGVDPAHAGTALRGNPARFFGPDAYPADAIRAGAQGRTVARLVVAANGVPTSCTVTRSSGWRSLDATTCAIAIGRMRFDPARDMRGRPIASHYLLPVRWVLPPP